MDVLRLNVEESRFAVSGLNREDRHLEITWGDTHVSRFHHVWLRHNCPCSICRNEGTDQNMNLIEDLSLDNAPVAVNVIDDELHITWSDDGHDTRYGLGWLRANCYSETARRERRVDPILVDARTAQSLETFPYRDYADTDAGLLKVMQAVNTYGFVRLTGAPQVDEEIVRIAERFGPIRETNYGSINDMMVHEDKIVISYTDAALTAHMDEPYCYEPLGVGFFHCMASAMEQGGTSIFVDGFKIAEDIRRENPENFEILTTVPQQFMRRHEDEQEYWSEGCVIAVDYFGAVNGIRFAERPLAPLDIPEHLVERYYAALSDFASRVRKPENEIRFKLEGGDIAIFDNQRMMHGRTAFKGSRHLRTAYVERDFFHSNLRVLSRRFGRPLEGRLPGGARS